MNSSELRQLINEDLFRYAGALGFSAFVQTWRYEPGFRISFQMRLCRFLRATRLTRYGLYHIASILYHRTCIRYGVHIAFDTKIGGGLYLPHALNIVVNRRCIVGRNCNLSQGITLGVANRGERAGTPVIGDQVYIGPGAVVFGAITVENNAAIGANCVVTKDVPENGVVVGIPGKVISHDGSVGYVNQILEEGPELPQGRKG